MPKFEHIPFDQVDTIENAVIVWIDSDHAGGAMARISSNADGVMYDDQPDAVPVPEALEKAAVLQHEAGIEEDEPILIVLDAGHVGWDPAWGTLGGAEEPVNNHSAAQLSMLDRQAD